MKPVVAVVAAMAVTAAAFPGGLEERNYPVCGGGCWSQIHSNRVAPRSDWKPGCTSLFERTIIPCPTTTTKTITVQATVGGSTTTPTSYVTASTEITYTSPSTVTAAAATSYTTTDYAEKRAVEVTSQCTAKIASTTTIPTYFSSCRNFQQYSSICSCFPIPSLTTTQKRQTVTATTQVTVTVTTPATAATTTVTDSTAAASTTIYTPATTITPVVSVTSTSTVPTCTATSTAFPSGRYILLYEQIYTGFGYIENPNNPSNDDSSFPPVTITFNNSVDACDGIGQCIDYGITTLSDDDNYYNIDFHWRASLDGWECVLYWDGYSSAADYDDPDPDVERGYGWQLYNGVVA